MDGSDSSSLAVPRLPDGVIEDILSRLRAKSLKSLCRCKCVSKPWRDLIADRLCCQDLSQTLQGFLYFDVVSGGGDGSGGDDGNGSNDGDADADGGDVDGNGSNNVDADADGGDLASGRDEMLLRHGHGRFIDLLGKPVSLLDPSFAFMKERPGVKAVALLDSCNGLLLFGHRLVSDTYDSLGYIVCNPVTEQWVAVPSSGWTPTPPEEKWQKKLCTFLVFDPSVSSHFDLVQFWQYGLDDFFEVEGVHTYSSVTGLWSDRASEWRRWRKGGGWEKWGDCRIILQGYGSAVVNGMLHFPVRSIRTGLSEIVAVDSQGRTCRVIQWPEWRRYGFIGLSQGRLHCVMCKSDELSIWVLEDYNTEEWVLKHSARHLPEGVDPRDLDCNDFVGLHTDRNMMFYLHCKDQKLMSYNMDSREVRVLCTNSRARFSLCYPVCSFPQVVMKH